jgi:hypothetical protein
LIDDFLRYERHSNSSGWLVHVNNAASSNSKVIRNLVEHNALQKLSHTADSPDIALSDFYRFRKLTGQLIGQDIPDEMSFAEAVWAILNVSPPQNSSGSFEIGLNTSRK